MNTIALLIQAFSSIIQAVMTIGLLIVTLLYVIFTRKMLDQNYSTFVVITGLKHSGKNLLANIENHGTAIALNVSITLQPGRKNSSGRVSLNGPGMIFAGEKTVFKCELPAGTDSSEIFVNICYRSQTRRTRSGLWRIRLDEITYLGEK